MTTFAEPGLVGRKAALGRIDDWLARVRGGARALVITGEPGIGKTTLWRRTLTSWQRAGGELVVARPAEEELRLPTSALVDLFDPVMADAASLRAYDDPIALGRIVVAELRNVASRGPLLLAVDDLQWLDSASARALRYALRRLDSEPVGVLATARPDVPSGDLLGLRHLLPPGRIDTIELNPMSLIEIRQVVGRVVSAISPLVLRRLYEVSQGNPMFALELARSLSSAAPGSPPSAQLRLPRSLQAAIRHRLDAVPAEVVPVLQTVSALARAPVQQLRDAMPGTDVDAALTAASELGLLVISDRLEVRFSHPMIAAVVYDQMNPLARRVVHARLAEHTADPDLRARHLALSTDSPDDVIAGQLAVAARRASDRGAFGVAVDFAEHCVRLTPSGDTADFPEHSMSLVGYLAAAGEMTQARERADAIIAQLPPGPVRARALIVRAQLEADDLAAGEAQLVRALADTAVNSLLRGQVLDQLGWLRGIFRGDLAAGISCAREALAIADAYGDLEFQMSALAGLSNLETLAGCPRPDLMARSVALEDQIGRPPLWSGPRVLLAEQLLWAGDLAGARSLLEAAVADAEQRNQERWRPYSLYDLAAVEGAAGNFALADDLLRQAIEAARDCEDAHVESWIFYRLALVATWLGRRDEARSAAQRRIDSAARSGERPGIARARSVFGLLALSEGDAETAAAELSESVRVLAEMGFAHPGAIPAVPDAIEAMTLVGDVAAAQELLRVLRQQAAGVHSAWVDAAVTRAAGTVASARGDPAGPAMLSASADAFAAPGFSPDAARARLLQGRALVRRGKRVAAADALAGARDAFAAMGAPLWAQRAACELDRVAPGRSSGDLTPTERRVAGLVAEGKRNREIAHQLFMSVATVEAHLTRMFRKLNIKSRSELTRLVADGSIHV
jgi:DNA-binding CsgD family transcriptional regulator/tetratricopeptide (TPR) repeat protein